MTYDIFFLESARKEWDKLSPVLKSQFKKKLQERIQNPRISKDKLVGIEDCYKIKLRTAGYRLVYKVIEDRVLIQVIAVAKRDKNKVYKLTHARVYGLL